MMAHSIVLLVLELKLIFLCINPTTATNTTAMSQLLQCEYIDGRLIFRFPRLRQDWESEDNANVIELKYNNPKNSDILETRVFPLRRAGSRGRVGDYIHVLDSAAKWEINLNFRLLLQWTEKGDKRNESIENFHYISDRTRTIRPWANYWSRSMNADCFNFTTPYMVKTDCTHLELLYCARKQIMVPKPPKFKINAREYYLSDEDWTSEHCVKMDRECSKCRVPLADIRTENNRYQVCLTNTETRSKHPWECQMLTTQCGVIKEEGKSQFTNFIIWSSVGLALLLFMFLLSTSYAWWLKRRTRNTCNESTSTEEIQRNNYEKLEDIIITMNGKKYIELGEFDIRKHESRIPPAVAAAEIGASYTDTDGSDENDPLTPRLFKTTS